MPPLFLNKIPDRFDARFIQKCLSTLNLLEHDNQVVAVQEENLTGPEGNTGTIVTRLRIMYKFHQQHLPKTMVLKVSDTKRIKGPSHRDSPVERLVIYSAGLSIPRLYKLDGVSLPLHLHLESAVGCFTRWLYGLVVGAFEDSLSLQKLRDDLKMRLLKEILQRIAPSQEMDGSWVTNAETILQYSDVNLLKREILFYNQFYSMVSEPCGLKTPDVYLTAIEGSSNVFSQALFVMFKRKERVKGAILMEDLSEGHNLDSVEISSHETLSRLCTEVGRLYGYTARTLVLNNGRIGNGITPPKALTYKMVFMTSGVAKYYIKRKWTPKSGFVQTVLERWGDSDYSLLKEDPETLEALLALERRFRPWVYKLHKRLTKYHAILQGDFHAGNFMMMPNGDVKMFDMQMFGAGHPAEELCYFLTSNVDPTDESDEIALRMVHTAMETASQGVVQYAYEDLKRDVEICTLHYVAANISRRALFETPASVEKLRLKLGSKFEGLQRVLRVREARLLLRLKNIWKRDRSFTMLAPSKVLML